MVGSGSAKLPDGSLGTLCLEEPVDRAFESLDVAAAGHDDLFAAGVVKRRQEQMFDGEILRVAGPWPRESKLCNAQASSLLIMSLGLHGALQRKTVNLGRVNVQPQSSSRQYRGVYRPTSPRPALVHLQHDLVRFGAAVLWKTWFENLDDEIHGGEIIR